MRCLSQIAFIIFLSYSAFAQSPHGSGLSLDCSGCHTSTSWKVNPAKIFFSHANTKYELTGQHKNVDCRQCHVSLVFSDAKTNCIGCHRDMHKNSVGTDCQRCHTTENWIVNNTNLLHQSTRFPLVGNHAKSDCGSCHTDYKQLNFSVNGVTCYTCHTANYNSARNPNHIAANYSRNCDECHRSSTPTWRSSQFRHDSFPLEQGHKIEDCFACHKSGVFTGLSKDCYSCHNDKFSATSNPNHITAKFSTNCSECHAPTVWTESKFNHNLTTFPLTGKHTAVSCIECHKNGNYSSISKECKSCHDGAAAAVVTVNHKLGNFSQVCTDCHTTSAWKPSSFTHDATPFPLTGLHITQLCNRCHTAVYSGTSKECKTCHLAAMNAATNPDHKISNFPQVCTTCHTTTVWKPSSFNHGATAFPLTGAHVTQFCNKCHATQFAGTKTDCYSCHQAAYTSAVNPNHVTGGYPKDCVQCHNSNAWKPATFNHNATAFPLTGAHQTTECIKCHAAGYTGTTKDCKTCHLTAMNAATNPDHKVTNFPQVCTACHTTSDWKFDHGTGTSVDCYSCHQPAYVNSTNPNHVAGGYPTTCKTCHTTTAWIPSNFNHTATGFTIDGGHTTVTCGQCHPGNITRVDPACKTCHTPKYTATTNPSHTALSISLDCVTCHTTVKGWIPALFPNHAAYFAFAGAHIAIASNCASCHNGSYPVQTARVCDNCHSVKYNATTNPPHSLVAYSRTCTSCHTQTAWTPAPTYVHPTYSYTVKHSSKKCNECHTTNTAGYVPQCISCHQSDFNEEHKSSARKDCWASGCHTNPKNFDHRPARAKIRID